MRAENFGEPPDVVEGVVERRRGGTDDIRLAKIRLHPGGFELLVDLFGILVG